MYAIRRRLLDVLLPQPVVSKQPMVFPCGLSRSGTTLLATVLDAHSKIALGYELIPAPQLDVADLRALLQTTLPEIDNDFSRIGSKLRQEGKKDAGQWLSRCHRAGATADETDSVLAEAQHMWGGLGSLESLNRRLQLATMIVQRVAQRQNAAMCGFKFTSPNFKKGLRAFPQGRFIYILRDPRDVVASQRQQEFVHTLEQVCSDWNLQLQRFEEFRKAAPKHSVLIRYEDLTQSPESTLQRVFAILPVDLEPGVLRFQDSDASVFQSHHPNTQNLKRGFFTESTGRWQNDLKPQDIPTIERLCGPGMRRHNYLAPSLASGAPAAPSPSATVLYKLSFTEIAKHKAHFARRRVYIPQDYTQLLDPYINSHESLRLIDYIRDPAIGDRKILLIRHDVDHDHLTAVKIARWEKQHGLRSTFCLLHTTWYYGRFVHGSYQRTSDVLDCAREILSLGHEINFHNNLVVLALTHGIEPARILREELDFFRSNGVPIHGSSMHGDALCRQLDFRNSEFFTECVEERFGGPRTISHTAKGESAPRTYTLGQHSMFDFDLEYEAYDMARDIYHTDSGGQLRTRTDTRGRRPLGRPDPTRGQVIGVLTHPVWWKFP